MATLVSDPVRFIASQWEDNCGYSSAVLSGIAPDAAHLERGGYHCSIEDLYRFGNGDDYSNTRPDDKGLNPKYGAAIDMSMSTSDMIKCHNRVRAVWADRTDPRRQYLNAINTWDGSGDAVRLDFYANTERFASPDHKWHNHEETRRRYLLDWTAARAIVSALKGETKQQYMAGGGTVTISDEDCKKIATVWSGSESTPWDPTNNYSNGGALGDTARRVLAMQDKTLPQMNAMLIESKAREEAMLAAVTKLAEGGSNVDTAIIVKAINDTAASTSAQVAALQADLDATQAENEELRAALAAALNPNNN